MKDRFAGIWRTPLYRHKGTRIGTLWLDRGGIEGDVTITTDFLDMSAIERADVLNDIIGLLTDEYALAVSQMREPQAND